MATQHTKWNPDGIGARFATALLLCLLATTTLATPKLYFVHNDHLGTPRVVTDGNQEIVWEATEQTPFGEGAPDEDVDQDGTNTTLNIRFPGQYFDEESALHYNYFRDYDPSIGRYVQSDPVGILWDYSDPQLQLSIQERLIIPEWPFDALNHPYGYANQNPVQSVDPFGLTSDKAALLQAIARGDTRQIRNLLDALSDPKLIRQAEEALSKFGSKADDWIAQQCKGSVRREFPEELLDKTLEEIRRGTSADYNRAWKLLNDSRFRK